MEYKTTTTTNEKMTLLEEDSDNPIKPEDGDEVLTSHTTDAPNSKNKFSLANWKATNSLNPSTTLKVSYMEVRKPRNDEFIRTSSASENTYKGDLIELESTGELYLLHPDIAEEIRRLHSREGKRLIAVKEALLILAINRSDVAFIWRVGINTGKENSWLVSAANAAQVAQHRWIRMISNNPSKRYDYHEGSESPDPVWPTQTFEELMNLAFAGRIIGSMDHPVIRKLLGLE